MDIDIPRGMSAAEFEAYVNRHFPDTANRAKPQTVAELDRQRAEWRHAFADATRLRLGLPTEHPHPFCRELNGSSFERWAQVAGFRALTSSDFADMLANGYAEVVRAIPNPWDVTPFVSDVTAPNYRDVTLSTITVEDAKELAEDEQAPFASIANQATASRVQEFCINLAISRRLLVDSDKSLIDGMVTQAVSRLNAIPAKLLGGIITANPTLGDGAALFGSSNSVSGAGHTAAALNTAISKLSYQTTHDGSVIGFQPASVLVSYDLAATYATLLAALTPALSLRLQINPWIPASTAYLFANPAECASFNRLILRNGAAPRVVLGERPDKYDEDGQKISYNGIAISVQWTVGVSAVNRRGVVKITA